MKHVKIISNKTQVFKRFVAKPVSGCKTTFCCAEITEDEANEIEKTFTLEVDGKLIPVYVEKEFVTIHTQNVTNARYRRDIKQV